MNRTSQVHSAAEEQDCAMKNDEAAVAAAAAAAAAATVAAAAAAATSQSGGHHQQRNMLAEAIASLPPVPQNLSAIALFHQLPILYQQHYQHMLQSRILPYLQESLRLQGTANFVDKPQLQPAVSIGRRAP